MHSSRMRTFRCSGRLGGISGWGLPAQERVSRYWVSAWRGVCLEEVSAWGGGVSAHCVTPL